MANGRKHWLLVFAALFLCAAAAAELRTWRDASGAFEVEAEFVDSTSESVRLRRADGKEIEVPLDRLSRKDRAYLRERGQSGPELSGGELTEQDQLADLATRFFTDLKTTKRADAASLLTPPARKLAESGKSPLAGLPSPDEHTRAIRVRSAKVKSQRADVPVTVRSGGKSVKTTLHFERDGDAWRIAAISARLPDGERTINFEMAPGEKPNPLQELVGKPLPIRGVTVGGDEFSMSAYRGKVVLVDFWATWCGPCRAEIPNILANYQARHDEGFEVVAVSTDKSMDDLEQFVAEEQPPWVVLADRHPRNQHSMAGRYKIRFLPSLVLVGPDGVVVEVQCRGPRLAEALARHLPAQGG